MKKWSIKKANEWQKSIPWQRGFNYIPSCCAGLEMWQSYNHEEVFKCIDSELKLASEWGFNSVRISTSLFLYKVEHDSYLANLEEFLSIANKYGIYSCLTFGNDCCVIKENFHLPKLGPQSFDLGYHSGTKNSPHVVINKPGYNILEDKEWENLYYAMITEIVGKYKNDKRIVMWDMFNEPGNSQREMLSKDFLINSFKVARKLDPIQPLTAGCFRYKDDKPYAEIELLALDLSDVISYHCYHDYETATRIIKNLKDTYHRPLFNTEWLHRIWHCDVDQYPLFYKEQVGNYCWGFVTGKTQTREPWEWLFHEIELGHGRDWDMSKWQHDLVRANLKPYDFKEYNLIKVINDIAKKEESK